MLEFADWARDAVAERVADIPLNGLLACYLAGVGDGDSRSDRAVLGNAV